MLEEFRANVLKSHSQQISQDLVQLADDKEVLAIYGHSVNLSKNTAFYYYLILSFFFFLSFFFLVR